MKTTPRLTLIMAAAAALAASVAFADPNPATPGTVEFTGTLGFNRSTYSVENSDVSWSVTHLNAAAGAARSMNKDFQINGSVLLQHRALSGEGQNGVGLALGGTYNFPQQGNLVPFFSAGAGAISYFSDGETDKALLLPMVRAGFRSMIGSNKSLNVSMGFQYESNSKSALAGSATVFDVGVGVSLFHAN